MRFRRIEVRSYRAIDHAEVELGPGLNVLYGPNDLGKSTLASAMRAALLLPAESSAHQAFLPWHDAGPPRVRLTIEQDGTLYRVTKVFGSSSVGSAQLESSPDGSSYHEEERGRAVDRRLRELLRWGIEAPGGKSGARGLPESFLSHVLLGSQSDVPLILDGSLDADRDGSGRERLHEALQALSQDPVFKRVLAVAQAKVDAAFTPTGRRKTGQSSPLSPIKEQITQLAQEFERLTHQRRESEDVQARITSLGDERLRLEAELERLAARVARDDELAARLGARREVLERSVRAEQALAALEARRAELAASSAELEAQRGFAASSAASAARTAERQRDAEAALAALEQAALEASSPAALEQRTRARVELERELEQRRSAHAEALRLVELERQASAAQAAWDAQTAELAAAAAREAGKRQELADADAELERLRELTRLLVWREAERAVARGQAALGEAEALELQARELRARAVGSHATLPDISPATLAALRALEGQIGVTAARLDVGLGLVLEAPPGREVSLSVDGAPPRAVRVAERPLRERAKGRIAASIAGGITFEVHAGDPALRQALEALQQRWASEAAPLLEAFEATTLEALAERVEAERARRRELDAWTKEASSLELRAAEKRELAGDLEMARRRAEQRRRELSVADTSALEARLAELLAAAPRAKGSRSRPAAADAEGLDALLEGLQAETSKQRASADRALAAAAAERASAAARAALLGEARDSVQVQLAEAWRGRDAGVAAHPSAPELARRSGELEQASAAAARALAEHDQRLAAEAAAARDARENAMRVLAAARQAHDAAQAEARETRERVLTLETRVKERSAHLDPGAEASARAALEAVRAELAAFGSIDEAAPERLAQGRAELGKVQAELERTLAELRRAEGALGHVGGDVVAMREHQTHEALELARARELDQERDYDAYRLLLETMRAVENEQGAHLGRLLEVPVSDRFERLTEGRYRQVGLDAGLGLSGISVAGRPRAHAELSEGTREQLATILRLCIAEYLETALVLDDHLAQTHRQRAEWFRSTLREAAQRIQIVVLTARPEDYLAESEMCDGVPCKDVSAGGVRAIDLERVIRRARYGAPAEG